MTVKKIFITLIIIVACVMIGALLLNILMPNVTKELVNSLEDMIHSATGMTFDFNNDGNKGGEQEDYDGEYTGAKAEGQDTGNVDGFK